MFDLSITFNLAVFVAACALALVLLFFAIDIFAVKSPKKALRVSAIVIAVLTLIVSLVLLAVGVGMKLGFVELSGDAVVIFSLSIPYLARLAALTEYEASFALLGAIAALSLTNIIAASVKREQKSATAKEEPKPEGVADAPLSESPKKTESGTKPPVTEQESTYNLNDMHDIMEEISGLVDSLDGVEEPVLGESVEEPFEGGQSESAVSDIPDDGNADDVELVYEPVEESPQDYFSDIPTGEDDYEDDELSEDEEPEGEYGDGSIDEDENGESQGPALNDELSDEKDASSSPVTQDENEPESEDVGVESEGDIAAVVRPERVGQVQRHAFSAREIDDYTTVSQPKPARGDFSPKPRTIVRNPQAGDEQKENTRKSSEPVKEVEPQVGGLPVTKRHVIINRRNVVNMFSEYLKTKSADEKERIERSINTIIIK